MMILSASHEGSTKRGVPPVKLIQWANFTFVGVHAPKQRTYMNVLMRYVQLTDGPVLKLIGPAVRFTRWFYESSHDTIDGLNFAG